MDYVIWLNEIKEDQFSLVGGKGYNLGIMTRLGLPVPEGFAVTTKAFDDFLKITGIDEEIKKIIENTDIDNTKQLMEASDKIKKLIISKEIPQQIKKAIVEAYESLSFSNQISDGRLKSLISAGRDYALVAVRSSATAEDLPTASFAGQQATFLNVRGVKEVLDAVKGCWASLYEPRAIFYREKHNITSSSLCAVVQRMVNSDKSGVMFTVNPTTGEDNIVIEACWGLGETLVQGEVEPDLYIVSKDGKILKKKIGKKLIKRVRDFATDKTIVMPVPKEFQEVQVLTDEEILKLAEYGKILEEHYKHSQDIEFAIEKGKIYLVQTRNITVVEKERKVQAKGEILVKGLGASPGVGVGPVKIVRNLEDLEKIEKGDVLVTKMTSPDMVVAMSKAAAIVTDEGGIVCHAAIVSREMGIPAVVGTQNATKVLKEGEIVTVNAYDGEVYKGRVEVKVEQPEEKIESEGIKTVTKVKVNLVFPRRLEVAKKADGVGLLRIEHMITQYGVHPAKLIKEGKREEYIKLLIDGIKPIAEAFKGKPVWVRTLDARTDEFRNLKGGEEEPEESNPMLGWHGIRRSLDQPEILKAEFEAIKRLHEEGFNNVHIMLPFVIRASEFRKAKEIAKEVGLPKSVKIGIMVETPAAALDIEEFVNEGIEFVSFGTNDLTQLTLGIDRNNEHITKLFNEMHPSVLRQIEHVINVCRENGIETSVCGEAPSNKPEMVEFLVRAGISSISVEVDAIDKVREEVARVERKILDEILHGKRKE